MKKLSVKMRQNLTGWMFLTPAVFLIVVMSFIPLFQAVMMSFQTGKANDMQWVGLYNYIRMFRDTSFQQTTKTTLLYLVVSVPLIIFLGIVLAVLLNDQSLKLKGFYRTCIFLPSAISLVASAVIFRTLFATDGIVNTFLVHIGILRTGYNFLGHPNSAKVVMILMRVWRWVGFQMIFFLAGLQNIDSTLYEAAKIDGATSLQQFWKITIPLLKPTILFALITCTNSAIQVYDESVNLTNGGPGTSTMALTHYVYNTSFGNVPNFGYTCALSTVILIFVAILAFIQMKVGDKRE